MQKLVYVCCGGASQNCSIADKAGVELSESNSIKTRVALVRVNE